MMKNNYANKNKVFEKSRKSQISDDGFFIKPSASSQSFLNKINTPKKSCNKVNKSEMQKEKKPFDKKEWRLKKYSNKYKMNQWKEKRKKEVMGQYDKVRKQETDNGYVQKVYADADDGEETNDGINSANFKSKGFEIELKKCEKIKEEKLARKEEAEKRAAEKKEKIRMHKIKKAEKMRTLNKKTNKGQPIMRGRIEMLLEQIQQSVSKE